jgi:hypothetical protein
VFTALYRHKKRRLVFIWCLNLWYGISLNTTITNRKPDGGVSQAYSIAEVLFSLQKECDCFALRSPTANASSAIVIAELTNNRA